MTDNDIISIRYYTIATEMQKAFRIDPWIDMRQFRVRVNSGFGEDPCLN
jgi:hypothetical protein